MSFTTPVAANSDVLMSSMSATSGAELPRTAAPSLVAYWASGIVVTLTSTSLLWSLNILAMPTLGFSGRAQNEITVLPPPEVLSPPPQAATRAVHANAPRIAIRLLERAITAPPFLVLSSSLPRHLPEPFRERVFLTRTVGVADPGVKASLPYRCCSGRSGWSGWSGWGRSGRVTASRGPGAAMVAGQRLPAMRE